MEKELAEAKKAYREMRTKGLKDAMEAKKLADEAVKEELKALVIPIILAHLIKSGVHLQVGELSCSVSTSKHRNAIEAWV